jgi:predicted ester cyclase
MMKHVLPDINAHIQDIFAAEDLVAVCLTFRGTHSGAFQSLPGNRPERRIRQGSTACPTVSPKNGSAQAQRP